MASNEIESHFGTDSSTGLDEATVLQRLAQFGPNRLAEAKQQTIWQVFLEEIREPMILLLLGTGVLLRSEREPLFRPGFFSNRLMILWAVAAIAFVLFATLVPGVQNILKTTTLSGQDWLMVLVVTVIGTFWIEIRKLIFWYLIRAAAPGKRW